MSAKPAPSTSASASDAPRRPASGAARSSKEAPIVATVNDLSRSTQTRFAIFGTMFRVGRNARCDVALNSPTISDVAFLCQQCETGWEFIVRGANRVVLNDEPLDYGASRIVETEARVRVAPVYDLTFRFPVRKERSLEENLRELKDRATAFAEQIHIEILERMRRKFQELGAVVGKIEDARLLEVEKHIEDISRTRGLFEDREFVDFVAGESVYDRAVQFLTGDDGGLAEIAENDLHYGRLATAAPDAERGLAATAKNILTRIGVDDSTPIEESFRRVEEKYWAFWLENVKTKVNQDLRNYLALRYFKKTIKDVLFGYGPLEDLLRTPLISEIMVVDYKTIFVEKAGRLENSGRSFFSDEVTQSVINRIVARVNRHVDKSQPLVDARLSDGSRVNAVVAPIAVSGSCLTIRRFPLKRLTIDNMVKANSITESAAEFLRASVLARKNILVSGGTGSGKTTLLNCLCDYIPNDERIVTIEDVAELQIKKKHVVRMETKVENIEGKGAYSIRDLVKNALRMRPDRVIVGECRGGEAIDMLQAMNTGHDGSLTTIHANTAQDAVLRLETLVKQGGAELPVETIDRQIVSAIDVVVQLKRMKNGRRCVVQVAEVVGIDRETKDVVIRNLFLLDSEGSDDASLTPTGCLPSYMDVLLDRNLIGLEKFYVA